MSVRPALIDGLLLQAGWCAAVLGAACGHAWWGPGFAGLALGGHVLRSGGRRAAALRTLVAAAMLGLVHEHVQVALGTLRFDGPGLRWGAVPLWIVLLWPLFAASFGTAFAFLVGRPWWAALVGAVGGPPGYLVAERLGALALPRGGLVAFVSLGLGWALLLPAALALHRAAHVPCGDA